MKQMLGDELQQVYLLHYILLVLIDHWLFRGDGVSGDRPAVVGSLLLLIIPLTLVISYPFFMCVSWLLACTSSIKTGPACTLLPCPSHPNSKHLHPAAFAITCSPTLYHNPSCSYVDSPSVKIARIFCDFVMRKKQVVPK